MYRYRHRLLKAQLTKNRHVYFSKPYSTKERGKIYFGIMKPSHVRMRFLIAYQHPGPGGSFSIGIFRWKSLKHAFNTSIFIKEKKDNVLKKVFECLCCAWFVSMIFVSKDLQLFQGGKVCFVGGMQKYSLYIQAHALHRARCAQGDLDVYYIENPDHELTRTTSWAANII